MSNLPFSFDQVLDFAKKTGVPIEKQRAVVREFLQTKFIYHLFSNHLASKLSFVGGTSLRLLRGINRFSEDLDFDNLGLTEVQIKDLVLTVVNKFSKEGFDIELKTTNKNFELKFPNLLKELEISTDPREKLMIKVDYADKWKGQSPEIVLFSGYGYVESVVTNPKDQLLVQKLGAYVNRNTTQARDLYDIVWLFSQGAKVDIEFLKSNKLEGVLKQAKGKYIKEKNTLGGLKTKLAPFLFDLAEIRKLDMFNSVLDKLEE